MTDWRSAGIVGVAGFTTVLGVLTSLAILVWLVGRVVRRFKRHGETRESE